MTNAKPSIAILSDATLCRSGVAEILRERGFHVAEYAQSQELRAGASSHRPDVLLIDLDHEREDTMTLVRSLRHELPETRIVVIGTALRQGAADSSFDAGVETPYADVHALMAAATLDLRAPPRSPETRRQHELWESVTSRQRDVMRWLATGADNATIAGKLRIGERAVKAHVSTLLALFAAQNRTQLALIAHRAGLRPPPRACA